MDLTVSLQMGVMDEFIFKIIQINIHKLSFHRMERMENFRPNKTSSLGRSQEKQLQIKCNILHNRRIPLKV
jgi:hypothetical protein